MANIEKKSGGWGFPGIASGTGAFLVWLFLFLFIGSVPSQAEEDRIPRLADHRFTPNNLTGDPFVRTFVRNSLGMGTVVNLFIPVIEIDGKEVYGFEGDLANAILTFEFQQAIKEWVAFNAYVRVLGRLGTGTQTLLAEGITANTGFDFGWKFRLAERKKTSLSGSVNVGNESYTIVNLLDYVNGVVDGTEIPLVRNVPVMRGTVGLNYAWGLNDLIGFNFLAATGGGESVDRSDGNQWIMKYGLAADFDLKSRTDIPLGLVIAYGGDSFPDQGEGRTDFFQNGVLRVAYTGTSDFLISLDFSYGWYRPKDGGDSINLTSTLLNLRYYF